MGRFAFFLFFMIPGTPLWPFPLLVEPLSFVSRLISDGFLPEELLSVNTLPQEAKFMLFLVQNLLPLAFSILDVNSLVLT